MNIKSLSLLLYVLYLCSGCKTSTESCNHLSHDKNSAQYNSNHSQPHTPDSRPNKPFNYSQFYNDLQKSLHENDVAIDQELLERCKTNSRNQIQNEYTRLYQRQTIIDNNAKTKAYYDKQTTPSQ